MLFVNEMHNTQVSPEIPITYIDQNSISEDSVIILTTEEINDLNLEEGRQIIVSSVCTKNLYFLP